MQPLEMPSASGDLADPEARDRAVRALLTGLAEQGPWTGPVGVVGVEVELPEGDREAWTVRFGTEGVQLVDADPQVLVRLPLAVVPRLVSGEADAALLHLAGVVEVVGDESLVLGIGSALITGAGRPLVDAAALDPVAVSAAIAGASVDHLAAVMDGGFRPLVLDEVFRRLPEFVIAEKARRVRVAIAFEIARSGEGHQAGGEPDRYVVRISDGACTVVAGAGPDEQVDATVVLEGHELLRLVTGHLNPVRGALTGELRVRGQLLKALGFHAVMRIPTAVGA